MMYGYARVSKEEQTLQNQMDQLQAAGCTHIFFESISTREKIRPEFEKMLSLLLRGDIVTVVSIDRLARSTYELIGLMERFNKSGIELKILRNGWDTTTPGGKLLFTLFAGVAEFERDLIAQRTKEGMNRARKQGKRVGAPLKLDIEKQQLMLDMLRQGCSKVYIAQVLGVTESTVYRKLNELGIYNRDFMERQIHKLQSRLTNMESGTAPYRKLAG